MILNLSRFLKVLFFLLIIFIFFIAILNLVYYFTYFQNVIFYPTKLNLPAVYKPIYFGFSASPVWINGFYHNTLADSTISFTILPYLFFGVFYLLIGFYALICIYYKRGLLFLSIIGAIIFFFLPYGYLLGTLLFVLPIGLIFFTKQFKIKTDKYKVRLHLNKLQP